MAQPKVKDGKKEKKTKQNKGQNHSIEVLGKVCKFVQFMTDKQNLLVKVNKN